MHHNSASKHQHFQEIFLPFIEATPPGIYKTNNQNANAHTSKTLVQAIL
jgi:hypothetical protein